MSEMSQVAQPYAKAAFEFACSRNALSLWQNLLQSASQISNDTQMRMLLSHPLTAQYGSQLLQELCQPEGNPYTSNFLQLLARNQRLNALPEIYQQFIQLQQTQAKQETVEIITARSLTTQQEHQLNRALAKRLNRQVTLHIQVDPKLLAGLIIRIGDWMLDRSIRGRLNQFARKLQA
ncbi:MAG: F0F1 ATP synthase subunit delta [Candidatus Symbiodolus clandestinus]